MGRLAQQVPRAATAHHLPAPALHGTADLITGPGSAALTLLTLVQGTLVGRPAERAA